MTTLKHALIGYGAWLMARQLGRELPRDGPLAALIGSADLTADRQIDSARRVLGDWSGEVPAPAAPGRMRSIFSFVRYEDERRERVQAEMPRRTLTIDLTEVTDESADALWEGFWSDVRRLRPGWGLFETFTALMARYGWNVVGALESEGISVFEQFKAAAALAHVCDPQHDEVLLVAGDLPGIQETLYTITSKGAAKTLRGRSFYLQLVTDAIVRALLRDLGLPSACVISNAGGNFRLLARTTDGETLAVLRQEINRRLLELHDGELFLALAWTPVPVDDLGTPGFSRAVEAVAERLDEQKARTFADLAEADYTATFGPTGFGGLYHCEVCHVDLEEEEPALCSQCESLQQLARLIADTDDAPFLAVRDLGGLQPIEGLVRGRGKPPWVTVLRALGYGYAFGAEARRLALEDRVYLQRLNDSDCLPERVNGDCAYGFRFLANTTPRIGAGEDLQRLQALLDRDDEPVSVNAIRSTSLMARWDRAGIDRYGVLRMDVDDLGTLLANRLVMPDLPHTSALSAALSLFFEGWLNRLCHAAADEWQALAGEVTGDPRSRERCKLPYVIYAGGDDLLIVGPWDVLPVVARHVRRDLGSYVVRGHVDPSTAVQETPLTVSAGIFAEAAKFPLYQAAEQAGESLSAAKRRKARRRKHGAEELVVVKDAVNFLDTTVSWEEFEHATALALKLARLVGVGIAWSAHRTDTAPRALIQLLAAVAREYAAAGGEATEERLPYGRWMPLLAYGLRRMVDRVPAANTELRRQLMTLAGDTLDLTRADGAAQWHTIRFLGLPVRWAEFLLRKGG